MNLAKLDPLLAAAVSDKAADERLSLFLHTDESLDAEAERMLSGFDVQPVAPGQGLYTATLSRDDVDTLSDQGWVKYLRLAQRLRPMKPVFPG